MRGAVDKRRGERMCVAGTVGVGAASTNPPTLKVGLPLLCLLLRGAEALAGAFTV